MLVAGLRRGSFSFVRRSGNSILHSLAKFAKSISEDVIWMGDPPPLTLEVMFFDVNVYLLWCEWKFFSPPKKKKTQKNKTFSLTHPNVYKLLNYKGMNDIDIFFFLTDVFVDEHLCINYEL